MNELTIPSKKNIKPIVLNFAFYVWYAQCYTEVQLLS